MKFLVPLLTFVLFAYHVRIGRFPKARHIAAYFIALTAASALMTGFFLAAREDACSRYGRVVAGFITEKISSSGAQGTRTIGLRDASIKTDEGQEFFEELARHIVLGSPASWVIDYGYDCGRPRPCWGRDFVSREMWFHLRRGDRVEVRYDADGFGRERLETNPRMAVAVADIAIGAVIAFIAAAVAGLLPPFFRRVQRLQTTAVVTAVDEVVDGRTRRWRVRFAYLDDLGTQREAADLFMTSTWQTGDTGVAVYEVANPDIATLRSSSYSHRNVTAGSTRVARRAGM